MGCGLHAHAGLFAIIMRRDGRPSKRRRQKGNVPASSLLSFEMKRKNRPRALASHFGSGRAHPQRLRSRSRVQQLA